ncbi:amidase [Colletotrichum karsti]|uniref:amidase n=1 Tax=Colletotrichum karsti TaxID=1095194 RepID=A0A9P6IBJ3_9PEZI|nr:amidase [Colletotrichum karsti]KAF9879590.1 amidase [Colletotrichum karsti]
MGSITHPSSKPWEAVAEVSRQILRDSISKKWVLHRLPEGKDAGNVVQFLDQCGILSAEELDMTRSNVQRLLVKYKSGDWTAEAVTTAFSKRATVGNQLLNFATEFLAESALEQARALDLHFQKTGNLIGPLHGIPISVKEHVAIGGRICHASFVSKISNIALEDAHIVKLLKNAGAIIHLRTNQPQSLMHLDCDNNITGMTLNPLNPLLSPGGSSGGEGAAVGSGCSVIGVGTDIGGSVRVPASFCNAYGFKPTALRNPSLGLVGVLGGQESIRGCVGPLARDMGDLIRFEKAVLDQEPWDTETSLLPLSWKEVKLSPGELTVGILSDDGLVRPHPPVRRALLEAEKRLAAAGINAIPFSPLDHARGWEIVRKLYFPDGGERIRQALASSGEPLLPLTEHALSFSAPKPLTISDNWDLNLEREKYRREYHALMKARGVDVLLCPAYPGVGALQGQAKYWNYTSIWNVLDQPAVTFPSGVVANRTKDIPDADFQPRSEIEAREWDAYDRDLFDGVPVSVQLVGKHHQDEELLAAARLVEAALRE